jgi:putative transposase
MKRKQYTPEFKAKVVLQVLREEKTLGEIAADNELNPNQIRNWKREFLENAPKIFSESRDAKEIKAKEKEMEEDYQELLAKVRKLTVERDWLKKNLQKYLAPITRRSLLNVNSRLSIKRQSELLLVNRTSAYYAPVIKDIKRHALSN